MEDQRYKGGTCQNNKPGVEVHRMHLAQFHPMLKSYHCVEVPPMPKLADELLEARERR